MTVEFVRSPSVAGLEDASRYELLATFPFADPMAFIARYVFAANLTNLAFYGFLVFTLGLFVAALMSARPPAGELLAQLALMMVVMFALLIPLHESIHAAVYKLIGANGVTFRLIPRQLVVYTVADRFVIGAAEYVWLAVMPVVVVSAVLLVLMALMPGWGVFVSGLLAFHASSCVGDFAIVNFLWRHRRKRVYAYDDVTAQRSYFYAERAGAGGPTDPIS